MRQLIIWRNRLKKFRDYPWAVVPFLKKYLYYNWVADSYLKYYKDVIFLDYKDTVEALLQKNLSFVRFGDDVLDMVQGIGLYFNDWRQRYEPDLALRLKEVLSSKQPKLMVGFNPELFLMSKAEFKARGISEQYQYWTHSKVFLKDYLQPNQVYGRALCFQEKYYPELPYDKLIEHLRTKHLVIVASNIARFENKQFGLTTNYVEGPTSDAWSHYGDLLKKVEDIILPYEKEKTLIMSSLGPTSKVMAYDLTKKGYTVWDTGQFFDLALKRLKQERAT